MQWIRVVAVLTIMSVAAPIWAAVGPQVEVQVDGLSCPFCAFGMEKKLKRVEGLKEIKILIDEGRAVLSFKRGALVDFDVIQEAVRKGGFTPQAIRATLTGTLATDEGRLILHRDGESSGLLLSGGPGASRLESSAREGDRITVTGKVQKKDPAESGTYTYKISVDHFETVGASPKGSR